MTKEQKRNFCSKLENNIFFKNYICNNSDKIKILKKHKLKDIINDIDF